MKKILFLILLTFAACLELPLYKCDDDDLFKSDVAGLSFNNGTIPQLFIERTCNGKQIKNNGNVYYCSNNYEENRYQEFKSKSKKLGEECGIDADCWDETIYYRFYPKDSSVDNLLKCIDNVCKLPIECGQNQFIYETYNKTKPYDCRDYMEVNKTLNITNKPLNEITCPPDYILTKFYENATNYDGEIYKCIKRYSLPNGTILHWDEYDSNNPVGGWINKKEVCQSGMVADTDYLFCISPLSEEECKKDEGNSWKYKVNFTDVEELMAILNFEYECEKRGEYRYVENSAVTMAKSKYFENYVVDAYNKIDFKKIVEEGIDVNRNEEYKEYLKKQKIYENFNELYGQKIIDENGDPVNGKEKCFDFVIQQYFYSTSTASILKMSISIALLLLLV